VGLGTSTCGPGWGSNYILVSIYEDINSEEATEDLEGTEDLKVVKRVGALRMKYLMVMQHQTPPIQMRKTTLTLILILSICPVRMMKRLWMVSMTSAACKLPWPML